MTSLFLFGDKRGKMETDECKFEINNMHWKIMQKSTQELTDKYNSQYEQKAYYTFGVTLYPDHEIWINKDMCFEQQICTLKHELTHCYMWNYGLYNITEYNEEFICDLVSASNNFINEVVEKYKKQMRWYTNE